MRSGWLEPQLTTEPGVFFVAEKADQKIVEPDHLAVGAFLFARMEGLEVRGN